MAKADINTVHKVGTDDNTWGASGDAANDRKQSKKRKKCEVFHFSRSSNTPTLNPHSPKNKHDKKRQMGGKINCESKVFSFFTFSLLSVVT